MGLTVRSLLLHALVVLSAVLGAASARADKPCMKSTRIAEGDDNACVDPMDAETARGIALGTGSRATSMSTSALAYNPAGLSLGKLYHVQGQVDHMQGKTTALGASVVDSSTSQLAAGVGARGFFSGSDGMGGLDARLGLAFAFNDQMSLGLSGRYIDLTRDEKTDDGDTRTNELAKGFTMDASFRMMPTQGVHLAVLSYNFIDLDSPYVPVMVGGSLGFEVGSALIIGIDGITDVSTHATPQLIAGGGLEFLASESIPIRAGYRMDSAQRTHAISGGMGYSDRHVGLDVAVSREVSGGDDLRILFAMRYYVH